VSVGCVRPVMGAMEHRKVLYITPCTHFDGVDIAPQDGSRPDGDASAEVHLSNDRGIRININTLFDLRMVVQESADRHGGSL
jgi:hypothetical protein